jgi:prepilin-type N-terminal cleavage/methylation domain-containing protein
MSKRNQLRGSREEGFSLTELMVVVGIIAIMAAVGFPQIARYMRNYELKSASQAVLSEINTARTKAVMRNVNVGVLFVTLNSTDFRYVIEDRPCAVAAASPPPSYVPCNSVATSLSSPPPTSQFGPVRSLPLGVVFATTGCPLLAAASPAPTPVAVGGVRFHRLGDTCNPYSTTTDAGCPAPNIGVTPQSYVMMSPSDSTIPSATLICLQQARTGLNATVSISQGGRASVR